MTTPYSFGSTAMYECNAGFGLSHLTPRQCGGDDSSTIGVWSGAAPTCTGMWFVDNVLM